MEGFAWQVPVFKVDLIFQQFLPVIHLQITDSEATTLCITVTKPGGDLYRSEFSPALVADQFVLPQRSLTVLLSDQALIDNWSF